jgi:ferric-dicitrate binding protein FerR (iron transport regulator)
MRRRKIQSQAMTWVIHHTTSENFFQDWSAFEKWILDDPAHHDAYQEASRHWARCDRMAKLVWKDPARRWRTMQAISRYKTNRKARSKIINLLLCGLLVTGLLLGLLLF